MHVFIRTEPCVFTVGHYDPDGRWHAESDHTTASQASLRAMKLNSGFDIGEAEADNLIVGSWPGSGSPIAAEAVSDIDTPPTGPGLPHSRRATVLGARIGLALLGVIATAAALAAGFLVGAGWYQ